MAATDQTYHNQKTLDIVFAISCILMLLSTLWMFWQDYDRQFKHVQREFRDVEESMNEYQMLAQLPSQEQVADARRKVSEAKKNYEIEHDKVRAKERELMARHDLADNNYRSIKADFDSKTSFYNIAVEHLGKENEPNRQRTLKAEVDALDKELKELQAQLTKAQDELDKIDQDVRKDVAQPLAEPQQQVNQAEDDLKKLTAAFRSLCQSDGAETLEVRRRVSPTTHPRRLRVADENQATMAAGFDHRLRRLQGRAALRSLHFLSSRHRTRQLRSCVADALDALAADHRQGHRCHPGESGRQRARHTQE